jgi:hypothetical protein
MVKLAITSDAYGPLNLMPYEPSISVGLDTPQAVAVNIVGTPHTDFVGMASYVGVKLQQRIQDYEVSYTRDCFRDTTGHFKRYTEGLTLHFYAEVQKVVKFSGGDFSIEYV